MKRINRGLMTTLLASIVIVSILLSGCGAASAAVLPSIVVKPNLVSAITSSGITSNQSYINILVNSVEFPGKVDNYGDTGNLQLIMVVSDDSGHADALICPYGGVMSVHRGDRVEPCKAGITYPEDMLQGNLYVMLIALDVKNSSAIGDLGTSGLSTAISFGIQQAITHIAGAEAISAAGPWAVAGFLVLDTVVSFGGSELEKYFQQNYVIGTQSFVLSREYQWNNGQAITASSTNSQVNFTFTVQESSTAGGQIVEATPTAPINTNPPSATNIPNAPNPSSSTDPEQFVRTYFYSLTHDRNYQNSWSLLTDGFKNKNSPGGYNDYVTFWDKIDSVDVNSINFFEQTSTDAKCAVNLTFNAKQGGNQTVNIKYHLIYNSDRQTWLFESP